MRNLYLYLILAMALLGMFWLSLSPTPLPQNAVQDMLGPFDHVVLHNALALICFWTWRGKTGRVALALIILAIALELGQLAVPVRAFEISDIIGSLVGVAVGFGLYRLIRAQRPAQTGSGR
jgi:VanZ family protein